MELNKLDNETADHVIDLINTLINTPIISAATNFRLISDDNDTDFCYISDNNTKT